MWPILNFLRNNPLQPNHLYGFFSPSFFAKTGLESAEIYKRLDGAAFKDCSAVLFPVFWEQIAFCINVFKHGEVLHPGLYDISKTFLARHGINPGNIVNHSKNSTFSNYVVARPEYWNEWRKLAEDLFAVCEVPGSELGNMLTTYRDPDKATTPMKVFLQERFCGVILTAKRFRTGFFDIGDRTIVSHPGLQALWARRRLQALDELKQLFTSTGDEDYFKIFLKMRVELQTTLAKLSASRRSVEQVRISPDG